MRDVAKLTEKIKRCVPCVQLGGRLSSTAAMSARLYMDLVDTQSELSSESVVHHTSQSISTGCDSVAEDIMQTSNVTLGPRHSCQVVNWCVHENSKQNSGLHHENYMYQKTEFWGEIPKI